MDKKDHDVIHSNSVSQDFAPNVHTMEGDHFRRGRISSTTHASFKAENAYACSVSIDDENNDVESELSNWFSRNIERIDIRAKEWFSRNQAFMLRGLKFIMVLLYVTYFGYCMHNSFGDRNSVILLLTTILVVTKVSWSKLSLYLPDLSLMSKSFSSEKGKRVRVVFRYLLYVAATVGFGVFFGISILQGNPQNLQSLLGIIVFILICFMASTAPGKVKWHPVFWGFMIQFGFALLTLRTVTGYNVFKWLGDNVQGFIQFSDIGSAFVLTKDFRSFGLAFYATGPLIFFNSVIFILNHVGVIEFVVLKLGMILHYCLDTGPVESVIAAANIFIGLAEAPLLIRPYLPTVSLSELNAIMTCGFASIAGGSIAIFIRDGAPANHLLTAAIISAPSALAFAKVLHPEMKRVNYDNQKYITMKDDSTNSNILQACSEGALQAVPIAVAVAANMLAITSLLGFLDAMLAWFGMRAGFEGITFERFIPGLAAVPSSWVLPKMVCSSEFPLIEKLFFVADQLYLLLWKFICSYILFPVAYVMGVPKEDCGLVGSLIGIKLFATPIAGYSTLGEIIKNREVFEDYITTTNGTWHWSGTDVILHAANTTLVRGFMQVRSEVIATYAMCGFSAFTAIGICLGALIPMCPSRKEQIVQLVMRAFLGGNVASFATGSVAGMMYAGF